MKKPTCVRHHPSHVGQGEASRAVRDMWGGVLHVCADGTRRRHAPTGEVAVRSRHRYVMFDGSWNSAEVNVDASLGPWDHTGDFGRLDAKGLLYFVERKTDSRRRWGPCNAVRRVMKYQPRQRGVTPTMTCMRWVSSSS
jgi:acyl-coenzyme A synthetase/AMP-(fatty) acid ligase